MCAQSAARVLCGLIALAAATSCENWPTASRSEPVNVNPYLGLRDLSPRGEKEQLNICYIVHPDCILPQDDYAKLSRLNTDIGELFETMTGNAVNAVFEKATRIYNKKDPPSIQRYRKSIRSLDRNDWLLSPDALLVAQLSTARGNDQYGLLSIRLFDLRDAARAQSAALYAIRPLIAEAHATVRFSTIPHASLEALREAWRTTMTELLSSDRYVNYKASGHDDTPIAGLYGNHLDNSVEESVLFAADLLQEQESAVRPAPTDVSESESVAPAAADSPNSEQGEVPVQDEPEPGRSFPPEEQEDLDDLQILRDDS